MKGREFLDEDLGYHEDWWDYYYYDNYYYFDNFDEDVFKTTENGFVDWSEHMSTHLKRQHRLDEILGSSLDIRNNIGKFWPNDRKTK
jgi:hypothetical protein